LKQEETMGVEKPHYALRLATADDISALRGLIDVSVRNLQAQDYSEEQLDSALGTAYGVDTQLIADGTYYVAETVDGAERVIVGCGGWSQRKTLYGSDHGPYRDAGLLDPARDAAKIRAFFVHPDWVRRGIASLILETCEKAAYKQGFRRFEMGATLTGIPMYKTRGYTTGERIEVPLPNGLTLAVVRMSKSVR
jgi:GNAT superfamily N-acetyltransferase